MSQSASESTSGGVVFGDGGKSSVWLVGIVVAAVLVAFVVFNRKK
jgi:hypothetical protein